MNGENRAAGKEIPPSDSAPGQGTPVAGEMVPLTGALEVASGTDVSLFPIVRRAGKAAVFAAGEFFFGTIRNAHTRRAYLHAVRQFLAWAEAKGLGPGTQVYGSRHSTENSCRILPEKAFSIYEGVFARTRSDGRRMLFRLEDCSVRCRRRVR